MAQLSKFASDLDNAIIWMKEMGKHVQMEEETIEETQEGSA